MANKKIVLTGAGGFLGRHIVPELLNEDVSLVMITSRDRSTLERLCGIDLPKANARIANPTDFCVLQEEMQRADVLLNCAFPRNRDGEQLAQGLDFLQRVFELTVKCEVKSVINISSQSVYDPCRIEPADECSSICLESKYAVAKYATELMLKTVCSKIPHTNIRLGSLIGPGFDQRAVNKLVDAAITDRKLKIVEGRSKFGYFDVRDAAEAIVALAFSPAESWRECYVLGARESFELSQIAELVSAIVGKRFGELVALETIGTEARTTNSSLNTDRFYRQFDWEPSFSLARSISDILEEMVHPHEKET